MLQGSDRADSGKGRSWSAIVALQLAAVQQARKQNFFEPKRKPGERGFSARADQAELDDDDKQKQIILMNQHTGT